jgi:hypothetical protein
MAEVEARALRVVGNEEGGPEDLVREYLATLHPHARGEGP